MKYNVTNCPAFDQYECVSPDTKDICCWMNEDCIMKQIIKKCKMSMCHDLWKSEDILKLLEIEK